MKLIIVLLAYITISISPVAGQLLSYSTGIIEYKNELVPTADVTLSPTVGDARDRFSDWIDDTYSINLDGKRMLFFDKEYMTAKGVQIAALSDNLIDLYVKVDETKQEKTKLQIFASFGYQNWITEESAPDAYAALQDILKQFVAQYLPEYYEAKVEKAADKISNLEEKRASINNEIAHAQNKIRKLEDRIKDWQGQLQENQKVINEVKNGMEKNESMLKRVEKKVAKSKIK